ncbi:MAG TPA: phosphonate ABC transporter, permease protein PhnE [Ignavibacteria bacterium]|nr:phosphonate ABC transporter, permease protein PhnE [Ignavibacteria bacterium]
MNSDTLKNTGKFEFTKKLNKILLAIVLLQVVFISFGAVEFSLPKLIEGLPNMWKFLTGLFPPDFSIFPQVLDAVVITIQLALIGTILSAIIAFPLSFFAARNLTSESSIIGKIFRWFTQLIFNVTRSIDILIFALIFVSAVGLGPFPGVLALAIHSIGMLGKLFYESIETIDKGPVEALESVGASKSEIIRWAVLPQVMPYFISYFLFRFELNIRAAVVLGLVGAGGIGFLLNQYMMLFRYQEVSIILITIIGLVLSIDFLSSKLRKIVL